MRSHAALRLRSIAWVIVLVLAVPVLVPAVEGGYRQVHETSFDVTSRTVAVIAPAVGERPDGTLQGVGMEMEVTVRDGTGGVFVDTRPLTQIDMQGSARLAATMASGTAGVDMREHDFIVTIRSPAPTVGGPSAGATMTVAFTALLLDIPLRDDVVMTGMINPDGSIGAVGGILEKAEAAYRSDASIFLVPEGQGIVRQTVRETNESGWFPTVTTREEQVDVVETARQNWGIEVREVTDLHEAVLHMTDHRIERDAPPSEMPEPLFEGVMEEASAQQLAGATSDLATLRQRLGTSPVQDSPASVRELDETLDRAETLLERADNASARGSYYTASSLAFQSMIDLRIVRLWLDAVAAPDDRAALREAGRGAADRLEAAQANATDADPRTVSTLEAVGAAQVRALEASRLLDQAEAALADDRLAVAVQSLAFGIERTRSVDWWLDIAARLGEQDDGAALQADVGDLASDYFAIAQQAVIYAEVLLSQTGADETMRGLLQEAATSLGEAQQARTEGLRVGSLYLAMESQVTAHAALSLVGGEDLLEDRLERQRNRASIQVAQTRDHGAEPFLAVSYIEFAGTLAETQPLDALLMYGNAATIAATSTALATGELCGFGGASCPSGAPAVSRVGFPAPDPWTAYLALATVLLGFMAGVLVTLVVTQARDRRQAVPAARHAPPPAPAPLRWRRAQPRRPRAALQPLGSGPAVQRARPAEGVRVQLHHARRTRPALPGHGNAK